MEPDTDFPSEDTISGEPDTKPRRHRRGRIASQDGPDPVDIHVGERIKLRRTLMGIPQQKLGGVVGLTFQQIQKYERGFNRVSASMLYRIADALDVPVSFFFDAAPGGTVRSATAGDGGLARRETLELMRHYYAVPEDLRRQVYELVKAMARAAGGSEEGRDGY